VAGVVNSFDTMESFPSHVNKDATGLTSNNKITVLENKKNSSSTTTHETSHALGNAHSDQGGSLDIHGGGSVTRTNIAETLAGVGIGGNNIERNRTGKTSPTGDGTLYGSASGLSNGKVISTKRYERIMRRIERRNNR
jgi:hypothetical protein